MQTIAIIGSGPTGIYTTLALLRSGTPVSLAIFEREARVGVGMPYRNEDNSRLMLANIASIEIPPIQTTYLDWLRQQDAAYLAQFGVDRDGLHERQFLPRILLGEYFHHQFAALVRSAQDSGISVTLHASSEVTDLKALPDGVKLWVDDTPVAQLFDLAVIATGHVWPDDATSTRHFFPSPWSGLLGTRIPACRVGILGTSLSAIDAAMAVVAQHGRFVPCESMPGLRFDQDANSRDLRVLLVSRTGILPEADFYCPIPYAPLEVATPDAIEAAIQAGEDGLLDRIFTLVAAEIQLADPLWSDRVDLSTLDADTFATAYFHDRVRHDAFQWAAYNLEEVERNRQDQRTVPWRYAILRLHEAVQDAVSAFSEADRLRFSNGLGKVFIDNYAAIPPESIRRLLALRAAGIIDVVALGADYSLERGTQHTVVQAQGREHVFDVFIDARGQRPLETRDLPFPSLRRQLQAVGEDIPDVGDDYTLQAPSVAKGRIALGALPYLMHDQPFIQGITASAEIGAAIARAVRRPAHRLRRRLLFHAVPAGQGLD